MNTHKQQGETDGKLEQFIKDVINRKQGQLVRDIEDGTLEIPCFSNRGDSDAWFESTVLQLHADVWRIIFKRIVLEVFEPLPRIGEFA